MIPFVDAALSEIDVLIGRAAGDGRFPPRWGWHDDHRAADGTPDYLPALMQVRSEFADLLRLLDHEWGIARSGRTCLQLGMGECRASHAALSVPFFRVVTLDWGCLADGWEISDDGLDVLSDEAVAYAAARGPYDLVLFDANHLEAGVRREVESYRPLLKPGGIAAIHDALRRPGYEDEVTVWRYLETLREPVYLIGREVGIACLRGAAT